MSAKENDPGKKVVLCIGTVVLDIIARPIDMAAAWKEKQRIDHISLQTGGDAANQSVHLSSLGFYPVLNGCIGADENGNAVRSSLIQRGVDVSLLRVKQDMPTGTSIVLIEDSGERHIFSAKGAQGTLAGEDLPCRLPEQCRAVSIGSLFSIPEAEADGLGDLLDEARARKIPVFADLDSVRVKPDCERVFRLLPKVDYFLPSHYDLEALTSRADRKEAADFLRKLGVNHVIVKCGAEGCEVFSDEFCGKIPSIPVKSIDHTGAGDCMAAAFIARILSGDPLEDACRYACAAGALCTLWLGACSGKLTDGQIRERL